MQGPSVSLDLNSIVSDALMRAANDHLRKVDGASATEYVVADIVEALRKKNVFVVRPWETATPEAPETIGGTV
jgi:hypothetical protein